MDTQQDTQSVHSDTSGDERAERFPFGYCLCTPQDACACDGVKVETCPCYRLEVEPFAFDDDQAVAS